MSLPSVCIVTIFRNEANAICEWATHHIQQGVSRLFMIDHNSTDRWQEEVSPALRQHMTVVYEPRSSASEDKPVQVPLLNQHFLRAARAYTWVMGVDLDEFVFARGSHAGSIPSALAAVPWWRPGVRLTSKRFGSAELREQPRSMVEGFLRRYNLSAKSEHCGTRMKACSGSKSIVRTRGLWAFHIHWHYTLPLWNDFNMRVPPNDTEADLAAAPLHMNHYVVQSREWFFQVKAARGRVSGATERPGEAYFNKIEATANAVVDKELPLQQRRLSRRHAGRASAGPPQPLPACRDPPLFRQHHSPPARREVVLESV